MHKTGASEVWKDGRSERPNKTAMGLAEDGDALKRQAAAWETACLHHALGLTVFVFLASGDKTGPGLLLSLQSLWIVLVCPHCSCSFRGSGWLVKRDVQSNGQLLQLVKTVAGACQVNMWKCSFSTSVLTFFPNCILCHLTNASLYFIPSIYIFLNSKIKSVVLFSSKGESIHVLNLKMRC